MKKYRLVKDNEHVDVIKESEIVPITLSDTRILPSGGFKDIGHDRNAGSFNGKGIWLSSEYEWQIIHDEDGHLILICKRKTDSIKPC